MNTRRQELELQKAHLKEQISRRTNRLGDAANFPGPRREYLELLTTRIARINSELKALPQ